MNGFADYQVSKLAGSHDRASFSSGVAQLDIYLHQYALGHQRRNIGQTWVLHKVEETQVLGYYTLSGAEVKKEEIIAAVKHNLPDYPVPCVRIGKLAVDSRYQGLGLGGYLLTNALRKCKAISLAMGAYAVILDAIDESAEAFYLKYGFSKFPNQPLFLFCPIASIPRD